MDDFIAEASSALWLIVSSLQSGVYLRDNASIRESCSVTINIMTQRRIYQTEFPYFVTTAVKSRLPFFEDAHHATLLQAAILYRTAALHCDLFGYATLLDHVHLLMKPSEEANISKVMQQIKSTAARNLRLHANVLEKFWQPRFNFRIVNDEKRFRNTVAYLSNNHLKHGLDDKYSKAPYLYLNDELIHQWMR